MKKSKVIIISLLGMLLFVPFMTSARAQTTAASIDATVGEEYTWYLHSNWDTAKVEWETDNMTDIFAEVFGHYTPETDSNISAVFNHWSYYWNVPPQSNYPYIINEIGAVNATTGTQVINSTFGYRYTHGEVLGNVSFTIVNNTVDLADQWLNGTFLTTPYWMLYNMGCMFVIPDVNWTEFAERCDVGMEWVRNVSASWGGYNLTVTALANGVQIDIPVMEFGNNSRSITISATYYPNGHLSHYYFMYGADILIEIYMADDIDPIITDTPSVATVPFNYTGESLSWTATDANPGTYTIWVNMTEVASDIAWTSGMAVVYNIPDALAPGIHTYRISFEDYLGNSVSDTVLFTVEEEEEEEEEEETAQPPPIPGFEPLIIIGTGAIATLDLIFIIKKRK